MSPGKCKAKQLLMPFSALCPCKFNGNPECFVVNYSIRSTKLSSYVRIHCSVWLGLSCYLWRVCSLYRKQNYGDQSYRYATYHCILKWVSIKSLGLKQNQYLRLFEVPRLSLPWALQSPPSLNGLILTSFHSKWGVSECVCVCVWQ